MQINKENIRKKSIIVDHDFKVGDKVMLNNHAAYKYETPYKGAFAITQCRTNDTVTLHCGAIKNWYNICHINPYTSDICRINSYTYDTNVEDINPETND